MAHTLIVEDSKTTAALLAEIAKKENSNTSIAYTGKQAIELLNNTKFNLVLLDIELPDGNGLDILKNIRKKYNQPQLPVIVVSAKSDDDFIFKALDFGANDYISKPFKEIHLHLKIKNLLQTQSINNELEEKKAQFESIFNHSPLGISILNTIGGIEMRNPSYKRFFGYNEIGSDQNFGDNIHPQDIFKVQEQFAALLSGKIKQADEVISLQIPGKSTIYFRSVATVICGTDGQKKILTFNEDITEKIQAEQALKENEEKFRLIAENTADGLVIFNNKYCIEYVSPAYLNLLGYSEEEELGRDAKSVEQLIHSDDREVTIHKIFEAIDNKVNTLIYQYRALHKNGHYIWRRDNARFIYDKNGNYLKSYVVCSDITKENQNHENLLKHKTILEEAEKLSNIGSFEYDIPKNEFTPSKSWQKIHGTNKAIENKSELMAIAYPNDRHLIEIAFSNALKNIAPYNIEHRIIRQTDKETRIIKARGRVIFDKSNRPQKMYGSVEDITERKKAEKALQESLIDLKLAQEISKTGNWKFDPEVGIPEWSKYIYDIYERDPDLGPPHINEYKKIYDHQQYEIFKNAIDNALTKGIPYDIQLKLNLKNDKTKWIRAICQPEEHSKSSKYFLRGTIQDITFEKKAEQKLRESEQRFKVLFNLSPDAILLASQKTGRIISANRAASELFETDIENIIGRHQTELHPQTQKGKAEVSFKAGKLNDTKLTPPVELNIITPSGKEKVVEIIGKIIEIDNEKIVFGNFRDISKRKEAEEAIQKYSKQLEEANNTKDRFISVLGHDLKNPFNILLGFSELLLNKINQYDRNKIKDFVEAINITASQTYNLLTNLLEWSRSQQNKIPFRPETINLYHLIQESYMHISSMADAKKITVQMGIPEQITAVVDNEMIKTVIRNLISNAIKFTPENGNVNITAIKQADAIQIKICDNGVGMDNQKLKSLFNFDTKESQEGTKGEKGTGFGLLLCKEFIEKHNGSIQVESKVGKGSCFKVILPANNVA